MTAPASGRISAAKTGWVIILLMVGWALFLFLPFGREEKTESPKTPVERPGEAELAAVGLRYNVDWIGLPRYFAIWADRIEWFGGEREFAYWDPGSRSYAYIFMASRVDGRYRFRHVFTKAPVNLASESEPESDTHPFLFVLAKVPTLPEPLRPLPGTAPAHPMVDPLQADVDLPITRLEPPKKLDQDDSIYGKKP